MTGARGQKWPVEGFYGVVNQSAQYNIRREHQLSVIRSAVLSLHPSRNILFVSDQPKSWFLSTVPLDGILNGESLSILIQIIGIRVGTNPFTMASA